MIGAGYCERFKKAEPMSIAYKTIAKPLQFMDKPNLSIWKPRQDLNLYVK